jgi:hypothetical protein
MVGKTLPARPGITSVAVRAIPKDWDAEWFRGFITNYLQPADVRNATFTDGVKIVANSATGGSPTISVGTTGSSGPNLPGPLTVTNASAEAGSSVLTLVSSSTSANVGVADIDVQRASGTQNVCQSGPNLTLSESSGNGLVLQSSGGQIELWQLRNIGGGTIDGFEVLKVTEPVLPSTIGTLTFNVATGFNGKAAPAQATGYGTPTNATLVNNFPGTSATLAQCGGMISELVSVLQNLGFLGA